MSPSGSISDAGQPPRANSMSLVDERCLEESPDAAIQPLDQVAARPMFVASLVFLVFTAGLLQGLRSGITWVGTSFYWWGTLFLYPLFVGEFVAHAVAQSPRWKHGLGVLLIPPLRLMSRDRTAGTHVWMPALGWQQVTRSLERRVDKAFSGPMIVIALLILPLLAIEFFWLRNVKNNFYLSLFVETGTSIIWLAFTIEFIVMVSIVNKPLRYCREHWVDLVIILLPLVAFLRVLRLGSLMRLQQLGRMSRAYRLRGLLLRMFRAILILDVLGRLVSISPERRLRALEELLEEKEEEISEIHTQIRAIKEKLADDEDSTC